MHWVLQNNLHREEKHAILVDTLSKYDIPFSEIKVIPFTSGLPPIERMEPYVDPQGLVMVCGSTGLGNLAKDMNWSPGSFHNDNHDYRCWKDHFGDHLLNSQAIVAKFGEVEQHWDEFFIRPCEDTKSFSGNVVDWFEFKNWQHKVLDLKETYTTLDADTTVMYGPIKTIYREARFFIVDGKIATSSTYKIGDKVHYTSEIPPTMTDYANRMIGIWQPARAYVMDLALTDDADDGYNKIIEFNCINSSGFYDIDIQRFVMAIESMDF